MREHLERLDGKQRRLDDMADYTEEEKLEIAKYAKIVRKIPTARIAWAVRAKVQEHADKLWAIQRKQEDAEHHDKMMALPDGTRVLVKFGTKANNVGTIYGRGRKYLYVQLENGERWKFPARSLTEKTDDKLEKMTAQTNQVFQGVFSKVFAEADAKDKEEQ
jgi:hypothetical protein